MPRALLWGIDVIVSRRRLATHVVWARKAPRMHPMTDKLRDLAVAEIRDYGLILLDPEGNVVAWLCGAEEILGYSPEEMMGRPLARLFVQEDLDKGLDRHELRIAGVDSSSADDRWHVRKDGTHIWVTGTVTALKENGELVGYAKVLRDRTDLRIGIEARANELALAKAEVDQVREFVRTLGHELRNPLSPIKHSAVLLPRLSDDPKVQRLGETIANQSAVIERLASDLMDVSRLETGSLELRRVEIDVCELLREETAAHKLPATAKDVKLEALLPRGPLVIEGDADRLRQAVGNLLTNALKYTPPGGTIWVKATQEDSEVAIRVQDTGIGISPEALPKIFELFTREERAKEVAPGGLGVGLAIVRHIARLHGGVAQARSGGAGKGAEFTLRIPLPIRKDPVTVPSSI